MNVSFSCPSCGAPGSVDETLVGRRVRCPSCRHRFEVPEEGAMDPDGYALDGPDRLADVAGSPGPSTGSVFTPAPQEGPAARRRRVEGCRPARKASDRRDRPGIAWGRLMALAGILAVVALAGVALFAPRGVVLAGASMIVIGMAMIVIGYAAGAYGAFSEELLYGFLYLAIPLYTAYYLVTRWEDLARWFACSTAGVGLVVIGAQVLRWAGIEA